MLVVFLRDSQVKDTILGEVKAGSLESSGVWMTRIVLLQFSVNWTPPIDARASVGSTSSRGTSSRSTSSRSTSSGRSNSFSRNQGDQLFQTRKTLVLEPLEPFVVVTASSIGSKERGWDEAKPPIQSPDPNHFLRAVKSFCIGSVKVDWGMALFSIYKWIS